MRDDDIADWLSTRSWSDWIRTPIAGDASARRYERLIGPDQTSVILMDAPPEVCGTQKSFVTMAQHLTRLGLCAPEILAWDEPLGLLVLTDLGTTDFAKHLRTTPSDERMLYEHAVDVLRVLHSAPPPSDLIRMTPDVGTGMSDLAFDWAAKDQSADLRRAIEAELHRLLAEVDPAPGALSLRDFHAENLIWRHVEEGPRRVGLLDFQDAFVTHPTYDLASLLRDARRDVKVELVDDLLIRLDPDAHQESQRLAFHVMAVQRNLRILGIFQRLARRDGKARYLKFVPRVEDHLRADLSAPALSDLRTLISRAFFETGQP